MARKPRPQPYRIDWPLKQEGVENIDGMFGMLFDDLRNGATNVQVSAGTQSSGVTGLTFSNANNVTWGLSGAILTASVPSQTSLLFSNANNLTFGTAGSTLTASAPLNVSAGTATNNLTQLVFSNTNGVSFGLSGATVTASAAGGAGGGATVGFFDNGPLYAAFANQTSDASMVNVQFIAPQVYVSASVLRTILSQGFNNRTLSGTTASAAFTVQNVQTHAYVGYTQGTGASSLSMLSFTSGTVGSTVRTTGTFSDGSVYTVGYLATYPISGATSTFSTSYATTSASLVLSSSLLLSFAGFLLIDQPFSSMLTPGRYWFAFGSSTAQSRTGITNEASSNFTINQQRPAFNNPSIGFFFPPGVGSGSAPNLISGQGAYSTTTATFAFSAMNFTNFSVRQTYSNFYLQLIS